MDQFCSLKNDDYRRCSCSDRVYNLADMRATLQEASQQLTIFTENLDTVGMTAAQAAAMRKASEGENALTADTSASKALLQAIMNSIRGADSNVGGKYSELNSISISFDTANAFGMADSGQIIASYNGQGLYDAVYPQCRAAVREDCNNASLQRAITAYLMAVEQDCNTATAAIENSQAQMKAAVREGSAMLDLARVENRQKHNADDVATCLANVEAAVLSEEVCGANYHKCLDNGEFIDISTGAPIAGVVRFYELGRLLRFADGVAAANQKLSHNIANAVFVQNFENKTKKFAAPALDRCVEKADEVWSEYLDKAMLDIYYAQQAKVDEIKQGCFDFVASCYVNNDKSITAAMNSLTADSSIILKPYQIALTNQMCSDYIQSCNNMFDGNIIAQYIENIEDKDTLAACRAVLQQCFDKYGGTNYQNFYYPYSGLFAHGNAPDWFTLYDDNDNIVSECAKELTRIDACAPTDMLERAFGGLDKLWAEKKTEDMNSIVVYPITEKGDTENGAYYYGLKMTAAYTVGGQQLEMEYVSHRELRPVGVATEVYNKVIDALTTSCNNINGRFVQIQFKRDIEYGNDNMCIATFNDKEAKGAYFGLTEPFGIGENEDMCPANYNNEVDVKSWGACLCWENGGRRSKGGKISTCLPIVPVIDDRKDAACNNDDNVSTTWPVSDDKWCSKTNSIGQVCPPKYTDGDGGKGCVSGNNKLTAIPDVINSQRTQ